MDAFEVVIGQESAIGLLRAALMRDRIAPGYLFAGVPGIGRGLAAMAMAQMLVRDRQSSHRVRDRNHPDVLWVEPTYLDKGKLLAVKEAEAAGLKRRAAPQIRLEQVREVAEFLSHPPMESRRSVVIIADAQTMAEPAANGLLKTLEEPGQATIILLAPDAGSLLPTLVSRCQRIPFYRLATDKVQQVLVRLGYTDMPDRILTLAQGSPGAAIAAFEQFESIPPELLNSVQQLPTNPKIALNLAKQIAKELEVESQLWLIDYLQNYFWQQHGLVQVMQCLEEARQHLTSYVQPRLVWEVTLLQMLKPQSVSLN